MPNPVGFRSPQANLHSSDLATSRGDSPGLFKRWAVRIGLFLGFDLSRTAWGTQMRKHLVELVANAPASTQGDQALARILGQIKSLAHVSRLMPGRSAEAERSYMRLLCAHAKYSRNGATLDMSAKKLLQDSENLARKFDFESVVAATLRDQLGEVVRTGDGATLREFGDRFKRCAELMCVGIVNRAKLQEIVGGLAARLMSDAKDETEISDQYLSGLNRELRVLELVETMGEKVPGTFHPSAQSEDLLSEVDDPCTDSDSASGARVLANARARSKIDQDAEYGDPDSESNNLGSINNQFDQ